MRPRKLTEAEAADRQRCLLDLLLKADELAERCGLHWTLRKAIKARLHEAQGFVITGRRGEP